MKTLEDLDPLIKAERSQTKKEPDMALQESGAVQFWRLRMAGKSSDEAILELAGLTGGSPEVWRQRFLSALYHMAGSDNLDDKWTRRVALLADQIHHVEFPESQTTSPSPEEAGQAGDMREFSGERPPVERPKASIDPKMALAHKLTNQAPLPVETGSGGDRGNSGG